MSTQSPSPKSTLSWALQVPAFAIGGDGTVMGFNDQALAAFPDACIEGSDRKHLTASITKGSPADIDELDRILCDPVSRQAQICADGKRWAVSCLPIEGGRMLILQSIGIADQAAVADDEERMLETSRSRFIQTMSHELRTPLNTIAGFAEMIALQAFGSSDNGRYKEYGRYIVEATGKTIEAVDALITLASLESNGAQIMLETIDANTAIEAALDAVKSTHATARFVFEPSPNRVLLRADSDLLHQALAAISAELSRNAAADSTIHVTVEARDHGACFAFSGFAPEGTSNESLACSAGAGIWVATTVAEAHGGGLRFTKKCSGKPKIKLVFP